LPRSAYHLASLHRIEGVVHVLELAGARDQLVELEAALPVQLDVGRHVEAEAIGAHPATDQLLLADELACGKIETCVGREEADQDGGTRFADGCEGLLGRELVADGLEGVVDAARNDLANRRDGIATRCIHSVRGAELKRRIQLRRRDIDRDHGSRAREIRALDGRQADSARTVHGHGRTCLDLGGAQCRAQTGEYTAADQGQ
jgi:hypothetical protein